MLPVAYTDMHTHMHVQKPITVLAICLALLFNASYRNSLRKPSQWFSPWFARCDYISYTGIQTKLSQVLYSYDAGQSCVKNVTDGASHSHVYTVKDSSLIRIEADLASSTDCSASFYIAL